MNSVIKSKAAVLALGIASAVLIGSAAMPAHAKEIKLKGNHSIEKIRAACSNAGGDMVVSSGRYGCVNSSKGTQVICTNGGECTGTVPRTKPSQGPTSAGTRPTGGVIADPKFPPKVNDARAPIGGGIFQAKAANAGGASAPIQKSNGGDGPSFRSTNGRR